MAASKIEFFPINYLAMRAAFSTDLSSDNMSKPYLFSVILPKYRGKWLLSRHCERTTWEFAGGHIETGETLLDAAKRELFEETGALEFTIRPIFDYQADLDGEIKGGAVFLAEITKLGALPPSEMCETRTFEALPLNMTYPSVQPSMAEHYDMLFGDKPQFLYHASRERHDILSPFPALGLLEENGTLNAVYAYENAKQAIPFALSISGREKMYVDDMTSEVYVSPDTTLDKEGTGYLYKLSSDSFYRLDEIQWVSKKAVTPLEIIEICSGDLTSQVHFEMPDGIGDILRRSKNYDG